MRRVKQDLAVNLEGKMVFSKRNPLTDQCQWRAKQMLKKAIIMYLLKNHSEKTRKKTAKSSYCITTTFFKTLDAGVETRNRYNPFEISPSVLKVKVELPRIKLLVR